MDYDIADEGASQQPMDSYLGGYSPESQLPSSIGASKVENYAE